MPTRIAPFSTRYRKAAVFSLLLITMLPASAEAQDDETLLKRTLNDYLAAFGSLEPQRVIPYYHEPLTVVSARRSLCLTTRSDVDAWLKEIYQREKERGWEGRNEYTQLHIRKLSADLAQANALYVRYKRDGQELQRYGMIYVLRKTSGGWKIAVLVAHDPETVKSFN